MKFFILFLFVSFSLLAGHGKGNGGGVEYCPNETDPQKMYKAYDLKEIEHTLDEKRKRKLDQSTSLVTTDDYFYNALKRVRDINPTLANAIIRARDYFVKNRIDYSEYELFKVDDVRTFYISKGCRYVQVVNWLDPEDAVPLTNKYETAILFDKVTYKKMPAQSQAAIDMHEAVYMIQRGFDIKQETSQQVRFFTGQAFSIGKIDKDLFSFVSHYKKDFINGVASFVLEKKCDFKPEKLNLVSAPRVVIKNISSFKVKDYAWKKIIKPQKSQSFYFSPSASSGHYSNRANLEFKSVMRFIFHDTSFLRDKESRLKLKLSFYACGESKEILVQAPARYHDPQKYQSFIKFSVQLFNSPI